jgi:hypothetical protein
VQQCYLPKIESDLQSEAISFIGEIVNMLPYALEIKETEDILMIIKHLYNLVEYSDSQDYTNIGYSIGAIAYDLKCMSEGQSTLGFLSTSYADFSLSTDTKWDQYDNFTNEYSGLTDALLVLKKHDVTRTSG